jgi:hypothetical protein
VHARGHRVSSMVRVEILLLPLDVSAAAAAAVAMAALALALALAAADACRASAAGTSEWRLTPCWGHFVPCGQQVSTHAHKRGQTQSAKAPCLLLPPPPPPPLLLLLLLVGKDALVVLTCMRLLRVQELTRRRRQH